MVTLNKKRGFTLVELLAVIAILGMIAVIVIPSVTKTIKRAERETFESHIRGIIRATTYEFKNLEMIGEILPETIYTFENGTETSNVAGSKLEYDGDAIQNGVVKINSDGKVSLALYNDDWCATKKYTSNNIEITDTQSCNIPEFADNSGANKPELVQGMTPIIWNGTDWVETTNVEDPYEQDWYDYSTKKWANAKTQDGSFWVWIPRYGYQIATNYHTSTAGTVNIKFLKLKTNMASDYTTVATTPTYSGISQTNYALHPAFNFGGEILGFWVAKFEPSGTANDINVVPNVESLRRMTIGEQFDAALAMKNNSKYGWTSSQVDTHMMKNDEWGAVAYLSKSVYGANEEIWINNSNTFTTGCAGSSVSASTYSGCQNKYHTETGQKASTTHNIYGIYDMSGGAYEYTSAYVSNGHSNLTAYGQSIINANDKYKNVYSIGTTDTAQNNYGANANIFGDAVYETSALGAGSSTSWYGDYASMPFSASPWFHRGGHYYNTSTTGVFNFVSENGVANGHLFSFRPVIVAS
ncbi:MAG: type II secretion system protein [Bacilli bacterium]|nr:type II secretion system protein [Bacilli bacterium]